MHVHSGVPELHVHVCCVSQSARVEKLEADVRKYRQKAEDTEYLRKRIAVSYLFCLHTYMCAAVTVCVLDLPLK